MRLRQLRLQNYGAFSDAALHFATEPGRLTLITAPNGAGKSVLRQAFHDVLFDIPARSPMSFRHGYPGMALHAEAVDPDGTAFRFGWVRNARPDRVTDDPVRFKALQDSISPKQLEQLFALDTARLRQGGTDLKGGQTLAEALLSGTGELASAQKVRAEIEARRLANWAPGSRKPPLNTAISELARTRKAAQSAVQRPPLRERQERALAAAEADHAAAQAAHARATDTTRRLGRIGLTRPHLLAVQEAEAWFAANPDAPALPPGLEAALAQARGDAATADARLLAAEQGLLAAEAQETGIGTDPAVPPHRAALDRLPGQLGEAEKATQDLVPRRAERDAARDAVARALRDVGATVPVHEAGSVVPPVALLTVTRAGITAHGQRRAAHVAATGRMQEAAQELADAEQVAILAAPAPEGLASLLKEILSDRNPAQHAAELDAAHRHAAAQLTASLAGAPGWTQDAAALHALRPLSETAYERLDQARTRLAAEAERQAERRDALHAARAQDQARLLSLQDRPLPDQAAIAAARAARDRGWALIQRRIVPPGTPDAAAEAAYAGDATLPATFERHLRAADDLADRRLDELSRVQEAERLVQQIAAADDACVAAEDGAARAVAAAQDAAGAWGAAVAPLGLPAQAGMAELRLLLTARQRVVADSKALQDAAGAQDAAAEAHRAWSARLATLLGLPAQPLPALLAAGEARVRAAQKAETAQAKQQGRLDAAQRGQRAAAAALRTAETALEGWAAQWADTLQQLGRPPGEAPEATAAVLDRLAQLDQAERESAQLTQRIDGMQADLDRFAAAVQALAQALDEPHGDPAATARRLIARRDRAAAQDHAREQAHRAVEERRRVHATAAEAARAATDAVQAVIASAGATDAGDAERRIAAAREHARHAAMRDAALQELRANGDGLPRTTLQADADAVPVEALHAERDEADRAAEAAFRLSQDTAVQLSELRTTHEADGAATTATDAAADHAAAAAVYARLLEEQLVLQLASQMLGSAMDAVQAEAGGGALARVSDAFGALTAGAYAIEAGEDTGAGVPIHAVERRFPNERKAVVELSEGTQDQLYLALRLVALREAPARLPFIADDILQTFDDARATAALGALLELSHHTQVIVLSHHTHVASLAQAFGDRIHRETLP